MCIGVRLMIWIGLRGLCADGSMNLTLHSRTSQMLLSLFSPAFHRNCSRRPSDFSKIQVTAGRPGIAIYMSRGLHSVLSCLVRSYFAPVSLILAKIGLRLLRGLICLDVSYNRLKKWPPQVEECKSLRDLRLDHNKLQEVSGEKSKGRQRRGVAMRLPLMPAYAQSKSISGWSKALFGVSLAPGKRC